MFEIEKMEQEFDYSLVDDNTADFLRSCEYEMNGIAEDARVKFGRVLKRVQDKLANHHDGVFVKWYKSGGMSKHDVYYAINIYEISGNLENSKRDNFLNAPKTLQQEIMKKNAPEELKQKVYDGDITTNKEYQEMKRKLKETEQAKQQAEYKAGMERKERERLEAENESLANREPEAKEIIKKVIPNHVNEEIEQLKRVVKANQKAYQKAEEELESYRLKDSGNFDEEKAEKEIKKLQWEAEKSVYRFINRVDDFMKTIAVFGFMDGEIASSSDTTKKRLKESVDQLKGFTRRMETSLRGRIEI